MKCALSVALLTGVMLTFTSGSGIEGTLDRIAAIIWPSEFIVTQLLLRLHLHFSTIAAIAAIN